MKPALKKTFAVALVAASMIGSGAALAWGGNCDGSGPHMGRMGGGPGGGFGAGPGAGGGGWSQLAPEQMQARMAERFELRMARLELALALKPEQQAAFAAFKAKMGERMAQRAQAMAANAGGQRPQSAVERMERMEQMHAARARELAESQEAVKGFYDQLNDAQQAVFDAEFQTMGGGAMRGGPGAMERMGGKQGMQRQQRMQAAQPRS